MIASAYLGRLFCVAVPAHYFNNNGRMVYYKPLSNHTILKNCVSVAIQ